MAAFLLDGWLQWLRHGLVPQPAALRSAPLSSIDTAHEGTLEAHEPQPWTLDVHRMSQAQARSAVLRALHAITEELPVREMEAHRQATAYGALAPT
jgi:hypothetical protein